jgi:hypothetical protein
MTGYLYKKQQPNGWFIVYDVDSFNKTEFTLHPEDVKKIEEYAKIFDNIEAIISTNTTVRFKLVHSGNNPLGGYLQAFAKLINDEEIISRLKEKTNQTKKTNEVDVLRQKVNESKDFFIAEVNRLNYVIKLMQESPESFMDSSLTSSVKGIVKSYEDYVNSKINFTSEYFKDEYWENPKNN